MDSEASSGNLSENDTEDLHASAQWGVAVWGLRLAGFGLFVAAGGLVTSVWASATGLTLLAVGVVGYLIGVVTVYAGLVPTIRALPEPRPSFWRLRRLLVHDALHTGPRPLQARPTQ